MTLYHNCIISHTKFPANKPYHNRPQCHLVSISMYWSSSTNSQHSLNSSKHSLLMIRDSIVFSVKHKLQQCLNGNNALYSTLASLWWSETYFYPISMSLVSDNNIMALALPWELLLLALNLWPACFLNILMARFLLHATSTAVLSSILKYSSSLPWLHQ